MKLLFVLLNLISTNLLLSAQEGPEMASTLRDSGKIYVVVMIIILIFSGIIAYLFLLERKIKKLEKKTKD